LGLCYSWEGDHAHALAALTQYLKIDPSINAYDSLGDVLMLAGEYDKAEEMKNKAAAEAEKTGSSLYYVKRSLVFLDILRGRDRAAQQRLNLLLDQNFRDPVERARFLAVQSYFYFRLGELAPALQACEQGLLLVNDELSSDAPRDELVWLKGLIELARKNLPGAQTALSQLRRMLDASSINDRNYKPAYKHYIHLLASIKTAEGKNEEAIQAIKDLIYVKEKLGYWSTLYDYAFIMDSIGQLYENLSSAQEAEQSYRDALAYNTKFAVAHFHLAQLLLKSGRNQEARDEFVRFRTLWATADADTPELVSAGQLLKTLSNAK